jgi:hypothetical protein
MSSLESRLSQAERLGRLEVELAAREATLEVQVRLHQVGIVPMYNWGACLSASATGLPGGFCMLGVFHLWPWFIAWRLGMDTF